MLIKSLNLYSTVDDCVNIVLGKSGNPDKTIKFSTHIHKA